MKIFPLLILLLLTPLVSLQAAIEVYEFDSPQQEALFRELGKELRCPKCQNNNIADSNAPLAQDLRGKVYQMLKEGKTREDVVDYMVARYGNFVTYNPPLTPSTLVLWASPVLLILVGFILLFRMSKNKKHALALSHDEKARLFELLETKASSEEELKK